MLGYIDPMAGTIVLQAIVAGLVGGLIFFRQQVGRLLRLITFRRPRTGGGSQNQG